MPVFNNILAGAAGQSGGAAAGYEIERSLRFNSADDAYINRTPSSASNRRTWTWSGWVKLCKNKGQTLFHAYSAQTDTGAFFLDWLSTGYLRVLGWSTTWRYTSAVFRDFSAWQHIVVALDTTTSTAADRIKIYINGSEVTDFSTTNNPSQDAELGINQAATHRIGNYTDGTSSYDYLDGYLADVHFIDGQALAATDFGAYDDNNNWNPKAYSGSYGTNGFHLDFSDNSSNAALGTDSSGGNNTWTVNSITANAIATGTVSGTGTPANASGSGGWAQAFDGSTSTLVYNSNGSTTTTFTLSTPIAWTNSIRIYAGQNGTSGTNIIANGVNLSSSITWALSGDWQDVTSQLTSPLTSLALTSVSGSSSNIRAVEIDGTVITQGDATEIDSLLDSPTNYDDGTNIGGNYCTLNPLDQNTATLTNGNLEAQVDTDGARFVRGTIAVSSGKWFWECTTLSGTGMALGVAETTGSGNLTHSQSYYYYGHSGALYGNSTGLNGSFSGSGLAVGDVLGVALDMDNGTLQYYKNGSLIGTAWTGLTGKTVAPAVGNGGGGPNITACNFGQRPFAYTPPTGYKSLCTQNLDDPLIADPSTLFDVDAYTGNGSTQERSEFSFEPDLVWIKGRSASYNHYLVDQVRGFNGSNARVLQPNLTNAEESADGPGDSFASFDDDGFTVKLGTGGWAGTNQNNATYVAWAWDAGSSNTSISVGSSNSSSYNTSRVWSNDWTANVYYSTYNATKVFDGDNSTGVAVTYPSTSTNIAVSPAISGSVIRVLYSKDNTSTVGSINGSETLPSTGSSATYVWRTLAATSISSIQLAHDNSGSSYIRAIEVDGKVLLDQGVSAVDNFPSIASTCRTNQTAGISIVSWTGNGANGAASVGHNLNAPVDFMIIKRRSGGSASWPVWWSAFESSGNTDYFFLDAPDNKGNGTYDFWNNLTPTSSVFHISDNANLNAQNDPMIGYIFSSVDGFSKFGVYQGGSSPFVYTGFRPAFVAIKGAHSSHWVMMDAARDPYNDLENHLHPNLSNSEATAADRMDFVSNGFKVRANYGESGDAQTYYYLAFAESPFKYSRAR